MILYELLTGKLPFRAQGGSWLEVLTAIRCQVPPHPCEVIASAPESLADLTMALLAKLPSRRPQNAEAVLQVLVPALEAAQPFLWGPCPEPDAPALPSTCADLWSAAEGPTGGPGAGPPQELVPAQPLRTRTMAWCGRPWPATHGRNRALGGHGRLIWIVGPVAVFALWIVILLFHSGWLGR